MSGSDRAKSMMVWLNCHGKGFSYNQSWSDSNIDAYTRLVPPCFCKMSLIMAKAASGSDKPMALMVFIWNSIKSRKSEREARKEKT